VAAAGRRGVATNSVGADGKWGRKDGLEFGLRAYARTTGRTVPRPETVAAVEPQVRAVVDAFAARGVVCIVKPANQARGNGIRILTPGTTWETTSDGDVVVQQLLDDPLLVSGHKADLRCYALVDGTRRDTSRRVGPIFVRLAPEPYRRAVAAAEITNTSYRRRTGLPPAIYPLDAVTPLAPAARRALAARVERLVDEVLDARFAVAAPDDGGHRVLLWGLDILPTAGGDVSLLEVNVHPQLFRGVRRCDVLVEQMLATTYAAALRRAVDAR
jgi:hypothetical protein